MQFKEFHNNNKMISLSRCRSSGSSSSFLQCLLFLSTICWCIVSQAICNQDFQFESGGGGGVSGISTDDDIKPPPLDSSLIETIQLSNFEKAIAKCSRDDTKILLSFILRSHQWNDIIEKKKDKAVNKLSNYFAIPKNFISLDNVSRKEIFEMTQLSSRRGLSHIVPGKNNLGRLQFMIGCGKVIFPVGQLISSQIGEQMSNGEINSVSGLDFGFWLIWPKSDKLQRRKRYAEEEEEEQEASGDIDEYEDYGDDEEGEEEITEMPTESTISKQQKHRHHHGETPLNIDRVDNDFKSTDTIRNTFVTNHNTDTTLSTLRTETSSRPSYSTSAAVPKFSNSKTTDDIEESLSKLESDITKTIENNTDKLKEADDEIQKFLNEKKKHTTITDQLIESNDKEILPIIETMFEEQIEINTRKSPVNIPPVEYDDDNDETENDDDDDDKEEEDGSHLINIDGKNKLDETTTLTISSTITTTATTSTTTVTPPTSSTPIPNTTGSTSTQASTTSSKATTTTPMSSPPIEIKPQSPAQPLPATTPLSSSSSSSLETTTQNHLLTSEQKLDVLVTSNTNKILDVTDEIVETTTIVTYTESNKNINESPVSTEENTPSTTDRFIVSSDSTPIVVVPKLSGFNEDLTPRVATTTPRPYRTTPRWSLTTPFEDYRDVNYDDDDEETDEITTPPPTIRTRIPIVAAVTTERQVPPTTTISSTFPTTTQTTTTEFVEPTNNAPTIKTRLPKQPLTAGKPFTLKIPLNIFYDAEDGTNLKLELFDNKEQPLNSISWIQFNPEKREIYGLPLEDSVSKWIFYLRATDSGGKYVTETVDLTVQQHKTHRSDNHEISIVVRLMKKVKSNVDWQIRLIRGIAEILSETSTSNIVVREVRPSQIDVNVATFVYSNESLPKDPCPEKQLEEVVKLLDVKEFSYALSPELSVQLVSGELIGRCKKPATETIALPKNYKPFARNEVDYVNATAGHLLVYRVPADTFFDPEYQELKLSLLTAEREPLDPKSWLQFDSKNQEFYGIPKKTDVGKMEYLLVAEDPGGLTGNDALIVVVEPPPRREYAAIFEFTLGIPYTEFNNSKSQKRFVERLARFFNDPSANNIELNTIWSGPHRTTVVNLYNTTLFKRNKRCPDEEIETIQNILMFSDGSMRDKVRDAILDFNLLNVSMTRLGSCHHFETSIYTAGIPLPKPEQDPPPQLPPAAEDREDYLLTFVLPAVIIIAMLLFASIVACYLHRHRRMTGKMELGDDEERRSFRSKGIPVIFQDELDEKPEIGNKSPVILKDEKPPLLPPSYNSTNPDENEDVDDYVPPPAVLMSGRESRGKSPVTPSYRKPPPYVSP